MSETIARPDRRLLAALVFVVGASSLGVEIAAARMLAPYFGASTIVWANTIGIVLVALSIGYWFGGRLGDRHPNMRSLCLMASAAAVLLAVVDPDRGARRPARRPGGGPPLRGLDGRVAGGHADGRAPADPLRRRATH